MTFDDPKIMIVGPGALGGFFAARLASRWPGVYLLDYRADRAAHIQDRGLHVNGVTMADWTPPPGRVKSEPRGWPVMDVAFFFVKAPIFPLVLKTVAPVLGPRTALVIFPESLEAEDVGPRKKQAVFALTEDRVRPDGVGRVFHEAAGETLLDGKAPAAKAVLSLLKEARMTAVLDRSLEEKRWLTRLAQIVVDVPTALVDAPHSRIQEEPLKSLGEQVLLECVDIAKVLGRPVPPAALRAKRDALILRTPTAKSPLGRDLLRGRMTERSALLDPLLAAAKKKKIAAPVLTAMDRLLRRLEKSGPPT
jgi:2-dehydropantoate 2-reductase